MAQLEIRNVTRRFGDFVALDNVIVLRIGVITPSQERLLEKEGRWLKLISGLVMVGLGVYLLLYQQ